MFSTQSSHSCCDTKPQRAQATRPPAPTANDPQPSTPSHRSTRATNTRLLRDFLRGVCAILLGLLLLPARTYAQSDNVDRLYRQARNAFEYGAYNKAIKLFRALLYPKPGKLTDEKRQREAHKYLGLSYFYSGQRKKARRELLQFLYLAPNAQLDPVLYPPNLVGFFRQLRRQHAKILKQLQKRTKKRAAPPIQIVPMVVEKQIYHRSLFLNFFPFGIPQFTNRQLIKGGLLLSGEVAMLALNITAYSIVLSMQIKDENSPQLGRFRQEDVAAAQVWQIIQFASLGILSGLVIYGVIDAFVFFRPRTTSVLPRLPRIDPNKLSPTPTSSFHHTQQF